MKVPQMPRMWMCMLSGPWTSRSYSAPDAPINQHKSRQTTLDSVHRPRRGTEALSGSAPTTLAAGLSGRARRRSPALRRARPARRGRSPRRRSPTRAPRRGAAAQAGRDRGSACRAAPRRRRRSRRNGRADGRARVGGALRRGASMRRPRMPICSTISTRSAAGDEVQRGKPNPDLYLLALRPPRRGARVGDRLRGLRPRRAGRARRRAGDRRRARPESPAARVVGALPDSASVPRRGLCTLSSVVWRDLC